MDAVALALVSALLFGAMSPLLRTALEAVPDAELGALVTLGTCFAICLVAALIELAVRGGAGFADVWPFLIAGVAAPGASQILFVRSIREAGPARASVVVGAAPLVSVAIALTLLGEPARAPLLVGAVLIVGGGLALMGEPVRPKGFAAIGIALAFAAAVLFASRDNAIRWLSGETDVDPMLAAAATAGAGALAVLIYATSGRGRRLARTKRGSVFVVPGIANGLSYVTLFAAYYRGRVTVVSPLVATEALFGVLFAALIIGRTELIGRHVVLGATLIVAGGVLIGAFR